MTATPIYVLCRCMPYMSNVYKFDTTSKNLNEALSTTVVMLASFSEMLTFELSEYAHVAFDSSLLVKLVASLMFVAVMTAGAS